MVNETVKHYNKKNPFEICWRFDFDPTLKSVCNINGESYDIDNLSEEDITEIEDNYRYLKSLEDFAKIYFSNNLDKLENVDKKARYIEYVNQGYPNKDEKTYSFKQFWRLSDGTKILDTYLPDKDGWSKELASLTEDGLFAFSNDTFGCLTQIIENGKVMMDYRTTTYGDKSRKELSSKIHNYIIENLNVN